MAAKTLARSGEKTAIQRTPANAWWVAYDIPAENGVHWQIGPLSLWISRSARDWRIVTARGKDPLEDTLVIKATLGSKEVPEAAEVRRFGFRKAAGRLELRPALADRPVVVNPEFPFALPPGEETSLYVSVSLWLQIRTGSPGYLLLDEPIFRPSDTWFGSSTMEGELCYAGRTGARVNLENLAVRPQRAICAVRIRNRATSVLQVQRMKLPVPNLSLFASTQGHLWTEALTLDRDQDGELAALRLGKGPPPEARDPVHVNGPRAKIERGLLIRTFAGHFAKGTDDV